MASINAASDRKLRIGLIGVGVGGNGLIPTIKASDRLQLLAAADTDPRQLTALRQAHPGVRTYDTAEKICADPDVDAIWIATPSNLHRAHVILAAESGKHIICFKPMGTSVREAAQMAEAADKHGVKLMVGGMLAYSGPLLAMHRLIESGKMGAVRAIHSLAYSDWVLLPRIPEEVDPQQGGGGACVDTLVSGAPCGHARAIIRPPSNSRTEQTRPSSTTVTGIS